VSKGSIISTINQSAEAISINASKINLNGVVTANSYFKILSDGSMQCTNGTFSGALSGATGYFAGSLTANTCYFNNLQANSSSGTMKIGGWTFANWGMGSPNGYFIMRYNSSYNRAEIAGTAPMWVGPYNSGVANPLTLFGTTITPISSETAYNMRFWVPGTQHSSLTPITPGTCKIGTSSYPFDVVYARSIHQTSLRAGKRNVKRARRGKRDEGYTSILDFNPVVYEMDGAQGTYMGLIAEEVEQVCPSICSYDRDTGELGGVQYGSLAVVCLAELQDVVKRLDALERKERKARNE
jgi:hypothetical protein